MIEILVVEDSPAKASQLVSVANSFLDTTPVRVDTAATAYDALVQLASRAYDLMVLDIQLPLRHGETPTRNAGVELLRTIERDDRYLKPAYIVGLTEYSDLFDEFQETFNRRLWHLIRYDAATSDWEAPIGRLLQHLAHRRSPVAAVYQCDLAIVTALHRVELEAVLGLPSAPQWEQETCEGDDSIYYRGGFAREDRQISVVAVAAPEMGMPAAAALTMKVIGRYRPKFLAMCGIAAGVRGSFGDVLVADQSWDYGSGKIKRDSHGIAEFHPAPSAIPLDRGLKARLDEFSVHSDVLVAIQSRWGGLAPLAQIAVQVGPVASGAAVLQDPIRVAEIVRHNRRLIGVEMETYGVFMANGVASEPRPRVMSIKSICDFANDAKDDRYQPYAAFTSAHFLYEFSLTHLATM